MEAQNNTLGEIYERIRDMPETFRGFVESECNWSTPTFYRHVKLPRLNSPVEREAMLKIARAQAVDLIALIDRQDNTLNAE